MILDFLPDSTVTGTWSTEWAPGADTTVQVGAQIGHGTLLGRQTEDGAYLDLNPGNADNNVTVLLFRTDGGFRGTWSWITITGPRTGGRVILTP
jgi:hypothetical protein